MILSKDKEKRKEQVANYVAKMEEKLNKEKEKQAKAAAVLKKPSSTKSGYVVASTAAQLTKQEEEEIRKTKIPTIGDILVSYETKSGKSGSAVYGFWLGRQYYSSLMNGKIKRPDKRIALGLAIAFNLKGAEFVKFVASLGYSFPSDKRDLIVNLFIESNRYNTRSCDDKLKAEQTNGNIDELDEMIMGFDEDLGLISGKYK